MPWKATCIVSLREEFTALAGVEGANVSGLCRRFGISRKTGYKWLGRRRESEPAALSDRSRRPRSSPRRTAAATEEAVLRLRDEHPAWGGRKLRAVLVREGATAVPAASTITEILRRRGRLDEAEAARHRAFVRFERSAPNELWQMDFKGHFALDGGGRCHPLTVLDDHSRFNVGLRACGDERGETVRRELTEMFRRYGLPRQMLMDNGSPWGCEAEYGETPLTVWLLRLGVRVAHGRAYHPQTQGKEERFHRTLQVELLNRGGFRDLSACQPRFDPWRDVYNLRRPHEALDLAVPASRYRPSERTFPERLPPLEYAPDVTVRKVQAEGWFSFRGRTFRIAKAFRGERLGLRPTTSDGRFEVLFGVVPLGVVDLHAEDRRVRRQADADRAAVGSVGVSVANGDGTDGPAPQP
jgi:transposase InsO family protein